MSSNTPKSIPAEFGAQEMLFPSPIQCVGCAEPEHISVSSPRNRIRQHLLGCNNRVVLWIFPFLHSLSFHHHPPQGHCHLFPSSQTGPLCKTCKSTQFGQGGEVPPAPETCCNQGLAAFFSEGVNTAGSPLWNVS